VVGFLVLKRELHAHPAGQHFHRRAPGGPGNRKLKAGLRSRGSEKGAEMAQLIVIEEFHVTLSLPSKLASAEVDGIRQTIDGRKFHSALRQQIHSVIGRFPALRSLRVRVSR
jgi:hypothetical protein